MKTWKNAEVVELNINETAWGLAPADKEWGFIIGTHDATGGKGGNGDTETGNGDDGKGNAVTPDTLS